MEKEKLFKDMKIFLDKLKEYRKTSILSFKNMDEKFLLKEVFNEVHPRVRVNLGCDSCIISYLNLLQVWYEREYPIYAAKRKNPILKSKCTTSNRVQLEDLESSKKQFM